MYRDTYITVDASRRAVLFVVRAYTIGSDRSLCAYVVSHMPAGSPIWSAIAVWCVELSLTLCLARQTAGPLYSVQQQYRVPG